MPFPSLTRNRKLEYTYAYIDRAVPIQIERDRIGQNKCTSIRKTLCGSERGEDKLSL